MGHPDLHRLVNNCRIHNEIGKIPPAEFEENYYRQIATPELVTSQTNESA
jgi:transposase InsO family protein